jgi:hypothetical protein
MSGQVGKESTDCEGRAYRDCKKEWTVARRRQAILAASGPAGEEEKGEGAS